MVGEISCRCPTPLASRCFDGRALSSPTPSAKDQPLCCVLVLPWPRREGRRQRCSGLLNSCLDSGWKRSCLPAREIPSFAPAVVSGVRFSWDSRVSADSGRRQGPPSFCGVCPGPKRCLFGLPTPPRSLCLLLKSSVCAAVDGLVRAGLGVLLSSLSGWLTAGLADEAPNVFLLSRSGNVVWTSQVLAVRLAAETRGFLLTLLALQLAHPGDFFSSRCLQKAISEACSRAPFPSELLCYWKLKCSVKTNCLTRKAVSTTDIFVCCFLYTRVLLSGKPRSV